MLLHVSIFPMRRKTSCSQACAMMINMVQHDDDDEMEAEALSLALVFLEHLLTNSSALGFPTY
jgi:hypothetical protein